MTEQPKTTKILLVCTGNICRSPLAAALLQRALTERGVEGMDVSSAGTGAWDGAPVSEGAYLVEPALEADQVGSLGHRRAVPGSGAGRGHVDSLDAALRESAL